VAGMKNLPEIRMIIQGGLEGKPEKVRNYTLALVDKLERDGDTKSGRRILQVLEQGQSRRLQPLDPSSHLFPVDSESRLPLIESRTFTEEESFLILEDSIMEIINEFIDLSYHSDLLIREGVTIPRNLLLYGPPGTGKTQTAKYISWKLKLPLIIARMDTLVSSFLGSTSKNIRTLFDFVDNLPCILFLDEFDAIAKLRDDTNELGELKRVVNSLLQNIDSLEGKIPVIAATNHDHLLDSAVWRRFDYKVRIPFPEETERFQIFEHFLFPIVQEKNQIELLSVLTEGFSGSDIFTLSNRILTKKILGKAPEITERILFDLYIEFLRSGIRTNENNNSETRKETIRQLYRAYPRRFPQRRLASIFGCSVGKMSSLLKKE
jgi:SpoVK/Ycf46/Vps4 family AAA+-type ATPase